MSQTQPAPRRSRAPGRRAFGGLTALILAVTALPTLAASGAEARTCAPVTSVLRTRPHVRHLPGGATLRSWQTGKGVRRERSVRIVAVSVPPASTLRTTVYHAGALTRHAKVSTMGKAHRKAVVVVNGSVFAMGGAGLPAEKFLAPSRLTMLDRKPSSTLSITKDGKARLAMLGLVGHVRTAAGRLAVNAVNTQRIAGHGVTVYTHGWGTRRHPHGSVELLVRSGRVVSIRSSRVRGAKVPPRSVALTASGSAATALRKLDRGAALSVAYAPSAVWQNSASKPKDTTTQPVAAVDVGSRVLRSGAVVTGGCGRRDETRRPRTAVGWKADGTMILMTITARSGRRDPATGGATSAQIGKYLRQLGAVDGSKLDGGGSTAMYVRYTAKGALHRVDRPGYLGSRSVSNVVGVELP